MKCFFCKGEAVATTTKFIVDQCGEASFDDDVAQQLERIVNAVKHSIMSEVAIVEYSRDVA